MAQCWAPMFRAKRCTSNSPKGKNGHAADEVPCVLNAGVQLATNNLCSTYIKVCARLEVSRKGSKMWLHLMLKKKKKKQTPYSRHYWKGLLFGGSDG